MATATAVRGLGSNKVIIGLQTIDRLDLGPIKVKLMDTEEGESWSVEQVNLAEKWYKRFLFLCLQYPSRPIVPAKVLDTFWHYHILDTQKYAEDSQNIFGRFLHHFPYFGIRGEEDAKNLKDAFGSTKELFVSEFNESLDELTKVFFLDNVKNSADCDNAPQCAPAGCGDCSSVVHGMDRSRPVFVG